MENKYLNLSQDVYFRFLNNKVSNDLSVVEIGYENFIKSKEKLTPRIQTDYILHFILSGKGVFFLENKMYHLHANQIFFIPPGKLMKYYPDENDPWQYCWIAYNGLKAKFFSDRAKLSVDSPVYEIKNSKILIHAFEQLFNFSSQSASVDIFALSTLYTFLALLIEERNIKLQHPVTIKEEYVTKVLDFISENYSKSTLKVPDIAHILHISHVYLCKIFKDIMGTSVKQYLTNYRLQKAGEILSKEICDIKNVAEKVGYQNQLYFSNAFKQRFGIAPSRYKTSNL